MKKFLNWYYGKASIRKKLVISYLVLALLPVIILGLYSYQVAKNNLMRQTKKTIHSNVSSIYYSMQTDIERENDNLKYLSYNASFRGSLEEGKRKPTALAQELTRSVEPILWYFITSDRNIKEILIFSSHTDHEIGSFLKTEEDCIEEPWYEYHKTNFKPLWTCQDGNIFLTRTLLDEATSSQMIGIMKMSLFAERFLEPMNSGDYLKNGYTLVDESGEIISQNALEDQKLEREIQELIAEGEISGQSETKQYILEVSDRMENGWRFFYYVDKKEIGAGVWKIFRSTMLAAGLCLILLTVLLSIISRILSTRMMRLRECAEEVGNGHFDIQVEQGYTDEIGIVAKSFGEMSHRINEMMEEMYQLGLEKRATELKALQAMINPHFLYNCLSGIKWKAIRSEQDEIADITGLLAKFYRTSLNDGRQITTVQNELENIRAYLEIQSRTHENSFDVEYCIDESGLSYEMPNFLLQPIIENAICHGVEYCEEGSRGLIRVEYCAAEKYLHFRMYNNGPAPDEEALQTVLNTPGKGYGLYNIQERIAMYYDETCGLTASVSEKGITCFTIKIRKELRK